MIRAKLIVLVFCIVSCASKKDFLSEESVKASLVNEKVRIVIDDNNSELYGPNVNSGEMSNGNRSNQVDRVKILVLMPAIYQSTAYIPTFELLSKKGEGQIIVTAGFTTILAFLLARYQKQNIVEWKYLKLIEKLKSKRIYSSEWIEAIKSYVREEFQGLKAQELPISVLTFNNMGNFQNKGAITEIVERQISLGVDTFIRSPNDNFISKLDQYRADEIIMIKTLTEIKHFNSKSYIWGLYGRLFSYYKENAEFFVTIKTCNPHIDLIKNFWSDLKCYTREVNSTFKERKID